MVGGLEQISLDAILQSLPLCMFIDNYYLRAQKSGEAMASLSPMPLYARG